MNNNLLNRKDEYFINFINEKNVTKSIKNLAQKNEYDNVVLSWMCQCSNTLKEISCSPETFREYLEKNSTHFLVRCWTCNKVCRIFNISLGTLSYEPQSEYFTNFMNENFYKISCYLSPLITRRKHDVCAIWSCQSCEFSNEQEKIFKLGYDCYYVLNKSKDFFWEKCSKCHNKCQISSLHLLTRRSNRLLYKFDGLCSITEIVRHLIDDNRYQIYGYWLCRSWKCRHELPCKSGFNCRYEWQSLHKWQCQHEPKCNGLWAMLRCRNRECKCLKKHDWKCENLLLE
ncbi:hypothetical protein RclHR1_06930007 [Rhizophagus clarus]|uniref:Uncharacterized protein n=1 Tax=Rhizophagus clarus TaxID=94130 RepID=A0A2Z6RU06_9GLOM|nr:hypothetical protein RclHR1_06930007 [Rhizophagus clarus]